DHSSRRGSRETRDASSRISRPECRRHSEYTTGHATRARLAQDRPGALLAEHAERGMGALCLRRLRNSLSLSECAAAQEPRTPEAIQCAPASVRVEQRTADRERASDERAADSMAAQRAHAEPERHGFHG